LLTTCLQLVYNMIDKQKLLEFVSKNEGTKTIHVVAVFGVSRQYASRLLALLVDEGTLVKIGSTRSAFYVTKEYVAKHHTLLPQRFEKKYSNTALEEHKILDEIEQNFPSYKKLPENIKSIFVFAFLEMLNNAIEHSQSKTIHIIVWIEKDILSFSINDFGIGVYRNIMKKRHLHSELEAIQDLLKGKMTTAPTMHSGEGIFFTSKVGDEFLLNSFGYEFIADNRIPDIFVKKSRGQKQGTQVTFHLSVHDKHHLSDVFKKYTNITPESDYGFDKTEIRVRLYVQGGVHISRSQARRVLSGLEKFKIIVMDYDRVPMVGQAFADEVYRVFKERHPGIEIENINMNEGVEFMVLRAINEAKKRSA